MSGIVFAQRRALNYTWAQVGPLVKKVNNRIVLFVEFVES